MGKTLAIFMVMAMIATGIVLLPASTEATGAYTVTGLIKDDVTNANVGGVKVTITNATLSVNKNVTSLSDGTFAISVENRADYTLTFEKVGYRNKAMDLLNATFNETSKKADVGIQLLEPLPTVTGTLKELGTSTVINDVEVTVKDGNTGTVIEQVMTVNGVFSVPVDTNVVDVYFKKNGYYDNNMEDVVVAAYGATNVGIVFIEKIVPTPTVKVWGIVFEEGTTITLSGAIVSISAGDDKWITAVSDDVGYFEMLAYSGNFQIKGSLTGYKSTIPVWFNVPVDKSVRMDLKLEKTPPETQILDGTIYELDGVTPIMNADIYLHSTDGKYVNHTMSDGMGYYEMYFYPPGTGVSFVLEVKKDGYFTNASATGITATSTHDVELTPINNVHKLSGFIYDSENDKPLKDATVTIYSKNYLYNQAAVTIASGYYEFMVHNNSAFWVAVDAEGYQSVVKNADAIVANRYLEVGLTTSGSDSITTTYTFANWNTVQVTRTNVITVDNVSARLSAERRYGMGPVGLSLNDGSLSAGEIQAWADNLKEKGAEKRDTKQFLTLNNTFYNLNATTYAVTIEGADGSVAADATIYINSTYEYTLAAALQNANSMKFTMGFNATYDTLYVDYMNNIVLPMTPVKFEMTSNSTETNKVEVIGYNNPITINPMVHDGEMEQITMTIQASMNGTAKAKILSGVHYVMNSTYDNYTVIVPRGPIAGMDTTVTFSAEDSTDKIGNIDMANYTWTLGDGTTAYGMKVEHNYTNASVSGLIAVKLVITETGGNQTNRTINVWIDSQNPVAAISAVVTDSANISYATNVLTVVEDFQIFFSGVKFSDAEGMGTQTIVGATSYDDIKSGDRKGLIEKWYWSWGEENSFDETVTKDGSKNITHVYNTPGTYSLNMIATDVVGRESANATWTVKVLDKTAPIADFKIRNVDKAIVTEAIENKTFSYNASTTTDNFDELANISFEWSFNVKGVFTNYTGMTVDHIFTKVGMYNVTLKATDVAGNSANKTMLVNVNLASRPNIIMKLGTMKFSSSPGTAGKAMTVSVNITNDGSENATGIQTKFYIRNADGTDKEIGTATTSFLGKGNTTTVSISWTPNKKGEFSIWANSTCAGEHSSQWWDNKIDDFTVQKVTVDEAPWVMPVIIVVIVVIIIAVFLGMRYFMKSGTKDDESGDKRKKR